MNAGLLRNSLEKSGRGRFELEVADSVAEALAWLSTTETDLLRGSWVAPNAGKVRFAAYAQEWLEAQRHLRPRTVESGAAWTATPDGMARQPAAGSAPSAIAMARTTSAPPAWSTESLSS